MDLRRTRLVASYAIPATLRNGSGISYVFVTFVLGIFVTEPILSLYELKIFPIDEVLQHLKTGITVMLAAVSLKASLGDLAALQQQGMLTDAAAWASFLLVDRPAILSVVLVLEMIFIPLFVSAGAFNQLSGDLQYGAVRYQLLRVSRSELFIGRFIGMASFTLVLICSVILAVVLYIGLRFDIYPWSDLLHWGGRGILVLGIMTLPYVALCTLISANVRSPFASLIICGAVVPGVPAIALSSMGVWKPLGKLIFLMPWGFQHRLLHPSESQVILAIGGCLAYTVAYLAIGCWLFRRRDL